MKKTWQQDSIYCQSVDGVILNVLSAIVMSIKNISICVNVNICLKTCNS